MNVSRAKHAIWRRFGAPSPKVVPPTRGQRGPLLRHCLCDVTCFLKPQDCFVTVYLNTG